ncbi:MAG: hypothetical protein DRP09_05030 [Candidatus Thorarchaeota archaeon]|nr:MAG: hypothetical protein DRP09_05030 [Candidatus Thorarchaeota archaeon]
MPIARAVVKTASPYLMMSAVILLWGMNYVVSRFLVGLDPIRVSGILLALIRYLLGAITMIGVMFYQRRGIHAIADEVRPYRRMLLISAFFSAVFVMVSHMATEFVSSGTTSIIVNLSPALVLVYSVVFLSEKLTLAKIVGFVLGLVGGLTILWTNLLFTSGLELGLSLALIGMVSWAGYTVALNYLEGADRYVVTTVNQITSTLMMVPFVVFVMMEGTSLILVLDIWSISGIVFSGILASGLAYVLYFSVIESLGAAKASSFLFLIPFVGLVGDFALGEPPGLIALLAGLIAIAGVGLVRMSQSDV